MEASILILDQFKADFAGKSCEGLMLKTGKYHILIIEKPDAPMKLKCFTCKSEAETMFNQYKTNQI
jgi:hypothetical protein